MKKGTAGTVPARKRFCWGCEQWFYALIDIQLYCSVSCAVKNGNTDEVARVRSFLDSLWAPKLQEKS